MRHFFAVMLIVLGMPVIAQEAEPIIGEVIFEDDPNRTLISKPGWLRGLHFLGEEIDVNRRPQIVALIPDSSPQTRSAQLICARITSISGNYEAIVQFSIPPREAPGTAGGTRPMDARTLSFDSKFPDALKSFTPDNSGIVVSRGVCVGDTAGETEYIATVWNNDLGAMTQPSGTAKMVLNMNIARADEIVPTARIAGNVRLDTPICEKIEGLETLAFNYRCEVVVPVARLSGSGATNLEFTYEALYRGRTSRPRTAKIEIGAMQ